MSENTGFKGGGPGEDEFIAQTLPIEALRMQLSRAAAVVRRELGGMRKRR